MICKNCGTDVTGMAYCPVCGAKVADEEKDNASTAQVKEESRFDYFMYKTFFANGKISYEDAEKGFVIGIIALQILQMVLMIFGITLSVLSVCTLLCVLLDWYSLSKRGIRGAWKIWGIFVTPVYLLIRTRKTNRKYIIPIISFVCVVVSLILAIGNSTNNSFVIKGYVETQEKIDEIDLRDYLPKQNMYLSYEGYEGKISYGYNVYPEYNRVIYSGEDELDALANIGAKEKKYFSSGYYYYDGAMDCLTETSINKFTQQQQNVVYLIPIGKSLKLDDNVSIEDSSYLYTVHTESKSYKDCVAVLKIDTESGRKVTIVTYYAKGIGKVLQVSDSSGKGFEVVSILKEAEKY